MRLLKSIFNWNSGVTIQPKLPSKISQEKDIKYKMSDVNSYEKYVTQLDDFLKRKLLLLFDLNDIKQKFFACFPFNRHTYCLENIYLIYRPIKLSGLQPSLNAPEVVKTSFSM